MWKKIGHRKKSWAEILMLGQASSGFHLSLSLSLSSLFSISPVLCTVHPFPFLLSKDLRLLLNFFTIHLHRSTSVLSWVISLSPDLSLSSFTLLYLLFSPILLPPCLALNSSFSQCSITQLRAFLIFHWLRGSVEKKIAIRGYESWP